MNVSKGEQRVLHALAQGGFIRHERDNGRISRKGLAVVRSQLDNR